MMESRKVFGFGEVLAKGLQHLRLQKPFESSLRREELRSNSIGKSSFVCLKKVSCETD